MNSKHMDPQSTRKTNKRKVIDDQISERTRSTYIKKNILNDQGNNRNFKRGALPTYMIWLNQSINFIFFWKGADFNIRTRLYTAVGSALSFTRSCWDKLLTNLLLFVFLERRTRPYNISMNPTCTKTCIIVTW